MKKFLTQRINSNNNSKCNMDQQRTSSTGTPTGAQPTLAARKQFSTSSSDPNEPAKPLSAYALFFRDTVSAVKQQNRNSNFNELQAIVHPMWEGLETQQKDVYNKKAETARMEYYRLLRIHRQQHQHSRQADDTGLVSNSDSSSDPSNNNSQIVDMDSHGEANVCSTSNDTSIVPGTGSHVVSFETGSEANSVSTTTATVGQQSPDCRQVPTSTDSSTNEESCVDSSTTALNGNQSPPKCTRGGCPNDAKISPEWDMEYCSNECVVIHCRYVFNAFVKENLKFSPRNEAPTSCVNDAADNGGGGISN